MRTRGALLWRPDSDWSVEEIEVREPVQNEVQIRLEAAGMCRSDEHVRSGATPPGLYPMLGGHEGAGVVVKVGPGVEDYAAGDHVVLSYIPGCGICEPCARGLQNLCERGENLMGGGETHGGPQVVVRGVNRPGVSGDFLV